MVALNLKDSGWELLAIYWIFQIEVEYTKKKCLLLGEIRS